MNFALRMRCGIVLAAKNGALPTQGASHALKTSAPLEIRVDFQSNKLLRGPSCSLHSAAVLQHLEVQQVVGFAVESH
jgi:hypothetical protein